LLPDAVLSKSITASTAIAEDEPDARELDVVDFSRATLAYVVSKTKISRKVKQLPGAASMRTERTNCAWFAPDVCDGSDGSGKDTGAGALSVKVVMV